MNNAGTDWRIKFEAALHAAMALAGFATEAALLKFATMDVDNTWGAKVGLVFYGASPELNERAAKFFEKWAGKNLAGFIKFGYDCQRSIGYAGKAWFSRYENGAKGWHMDNRCTLGTVDPAAGTITTDYGHVSRPVELIEGYATSFCYYPCAD